MADCTNGIEIEKNYFHTQATVFTKLYEILRNLNRTVLIMGIEARGINIDNLTSKAFDNMTYHTVGVFKVKAGKMTGTLYSKYLDPSGDFLVVEISQVGMERDWKYLYGTGKWKGVTGGGKAIPFTKGQPVSPGTIQNCTKITGTYELKK
jgi:hypothetical protein